MQELALHRILVRDADEQLRTTGSKPSETTSFRKG